jgi:hypothetical protein
MERKSIFIQTWMLLCSGHLITWLNVAESKSTCRKKGGDISWGKFYQSDRRGSTDGWI